MRRLDLLEGIKFFAVLTNCLLIGYTSNIFESLSTSERLFLAVALEHALLLLKLVMGACRPPAQGHASYHKSPRCSRSRTLPSPLLSTSYHHKPLNTD